MHFGDTLHSLTYKAIHCFCEGHRIQCAWPNLEASMSDWYLQVKVGSL